MQGKSRQVALGWPWGGFEMALYSQVYGFVVALYWLYLGWLWVPNRLPTACLPNGFGVALGWRWVADPGRRRLPDLTVLSIPARRAACRPATLTAAREGLLCT